MLHGYHLAGRDDFSLPAAEITRHPADPSLWGMRNLTAGPWLAREPSGRESQIAPGRAISLTEGFTLAFGSGTTGVVRT